MLSSKIATMLENKPFHNILYAMCLQHTHAVQYKAEGVQRVLAHTRQFQHSETLRQEDHNDKVIWGYIAINVSKK